GPPRPAPTVARRRFAAARSSRSSVRSTRPTLPSAPMKAIVYTETGGPEVLKLVDRPDPEPTGDEVVVRVAVSGVNPTDWKARTGDGPGRPLAFPEIVPNMDGAGTIVAVGAGVDP